jgi:hypothetical protein
MNMTVPLKVVRDNIKKVAELHHKPLKAVHEAKEKVTPVELPNKTQQKKIRK